jgi:hypothetical protein
VTVINLLMHELHVCAVVFVVLFNVHVCHLNLEFKTRSGLLFVFVVSKRSLLKFGMRLRISEL